MHMKSSEWKIIFDFQADERRQRETVRYEHEQQDNKAEIYNNLTSGMLAEAHLAAASALGPTRKVGAMYKGMTQADKDRIRKTQQEQIIQNKVNVSISTERWR